MNIAIAAGLLIAIAGGPPVGRAGSFDKPDRTVVLDLGRSQYVMPSEKRHVTVTCWYYRHFMIKQQNDPGLKGAGLIALAPIASEVPPKCLRALQPDEKEFRRWDQEQKRFVAWDGYFAGVKGDLVFLDDSEGDDNSGIPFTVLEARGLTKYFEDSATARNPREKA